MATAAKGTRTSASRREKDTLGEIEVPAEALWGAQAQRGIDNYPISGLHPFPAFVRALVSIKKAEALANAETGRLDARRRDAIVKACDEILAGEPGEPDPGRWARHVRARQPQ